VAEREPRSPLRILADAYLDQARAEDFHWENRMLRALDLACKRIAELEAENASMRHLMESARTYVLESESPCPDLVLRTRAYDRIRAEIQDLEVERG
jgi:hypothetical protein